MCTSLLSFARTLFCSRTPRAPGGGAAAAGADDVRGQYGLCGGGRPRAYVSAAAVHSCWHRAHFGTSHCACVWRPFCAAGAGGPDSHTAADCASAAAAAHRQRCAMVCAPCALIGTISIWLTGTGRPATWRRPFRASRTRTTCGTWCAAARGWVGGRGQGACAGTKAWRCRRCVSWRPASQTACWLPTAPSSSR
jgi:hypothetical protein